jgi:26S proteasome regulatory subunit N5
MLHRLKLMLTTDFKDVPLPLVFSEALRLFTCDEIIDTPFSGQDLIETHSSIHKYTSTNPELSTHFLDTFRVRLIQHNLRVIAKYYKRVYLHRLQELLHLSAVELEAQLSTLSFHGDLQLKIDRPAGIVCFGQPKASEEVLSDWAADVSKMLNLMETTCHLVNRECMVHKV